jgi:hypothetical protein
MIFKVLATPLYLEVSVPCQEGERSCIVWLVDIDFVSLFDLAIFSLALFRQCGIFGFSFLYETIHDLSPSRHGTDTSR